MTDSIPTAPPFDAELKTTLDAVNTQIPSSLPIEALSALRTSGFTPELEQLLEGREIEHTEHRVPGVDGAPDVLVSVFRRTNHVTPGPAFFFTHVGGMIFGDRFVGVAPVVDYVEKFDAVVVTVEFRLAPGTPYPAPLDDSYAALVWTANNAELLGFDPTKLVSIGGSAGGGVAAALALLARDKGTPTLAASVLMYAGMDERNDSVSARQIDGIGIWDRNSNDTGWNAYLGDRRETDSVPIYASPSLATDVTNLPPTYIEVGSAETFRDEDVAYATAIWAAGGAAELHVWAGGFHLFELFAPEAALSIAARDARSAWLQRTLNI